MKIKFGIAYENLASVCLALMSIQQPAAIFLYQRTSYIQAGQAHTMVLEHLSVAVNLGSPLF